MALLVGLVALVAAGKAVLFDTLDPDCFIHLLAADQLLNDGIGPLSDRQSFASALQPWPPYSWLAEIGMKFLWDRSGYRGAIIAHALLAAAIVGVVAASCVVKAPGAASEEDDLGGEREYEREVADPVKTPPRVSRLSAALATAFAAFLSLPYLSFRPVTAAVLLLAVGVLLLFRDRRLGERSLAVWLVVPLTALTVNVHLFAVAMPLFVGSLFLGALWERRGAFDPPDWPEADRRASRYALLLTGTLLACLATPMIASFPSAFIHMQSDPIVSSSVIAEYQPFYYGPLGLVAAALVGLLLLAAFNNRQRLRSGEAILLLVVFALLMRMGRFAPLFAVATAPILATVLPRFSDRLLGGRAVWALVAIVLGFGAWRVVGAFPGPTVPLEQWVNRHGPDTPGYPCAAAEYVERHVRPVTGRLVNEFTWGGYLEWRFRDRYLALLDGRTQCFSPELWRVTYLSSYETRKDFLSRVRADVAVLPAERSVFREALVELGWTQAYVDERAEVLVPPPGRASRLEAGVEAAWTWTQALFAE
jgi:hypothetical protein